MTPNKTNLLPLLLIVAAGAISQHSFANHPLPVRRVNTAEAVLRINIQDALRRIDTQDALHRINTQDAEVRYIPGKGGDLRFNVRYANVTGSRFSVAILDENGNQLYQDSYTDKNFDRVFKLSETDVTGKITFVIRNFEDNSTQRWEVHAVDRMIEDVEVKEVK
jgi:hypothetical protein